MFKFFKFIIKFVTINLRYFIILNIRYKFFTSSSLSVLSYWLFILLDFFLFSFIILNSNITRLPNQFLFYWWIFSNFSSLWAFSKMFDCFVPTNSFENRVNRFSCFSIDSCKSSLQMSSSGFNLIMLFFLPFFM